MATDTENSRLNWNSKNPVTYDDLNLGCLQRIADATEKMATNHQSLLDERDSYQRLYEMERTDNRRLRNRVAALRGVIGRMKRMAGK